MMKPDKWYQCRLAKYFEEHFMEYEDVALWWNDPAPNQWLFDIPERDERVELTCRDSGAIEVQIYHGMGYDK